MKVFVVNDDELILNIFQKILSKMNYDIEAAFFSDSELAWNELINEFQIKNSLPDLIILDLYMPKINGWEFIDLLDNKIHHSNLKVKIFTSSVSEDDILRIKQYSFIIDYVCKPLSPEVINDLLDFQN